MFIGFHVSALQLVISIIIGLTVAQYSKFSQKCYLCQFYHQKHSTAEAFVSTVLQFYPHSFIMPRNKKTPQEVKQIIDQLTMENEKDIKNKELNINFKKYENARIKLEAFQ